MSRIAILGTGISAFGAANLASALLGWALLDPLWHWILTLS